MFENVFRFSINASFIDAYDFGYNLWDILIQTLMYVFFLYHTVNAQIGEESQRVMPQSRLGKNVIFLVLETMTFK